MSDDNDLTIYDINNCLLSSSLRSQQAGGDANAIETVGDMGEFIKEEFLEVLTTPYLKSLAIEILIYELNDYKNDLPL